MARHASPGGFDRDVLGVVQHSKLDPDGIIPPRLDSSARYLGMLANHHMIPDFQAVTVRLIGASPCLGSTFAFPNVPQPPLYFEVTVGGNNSTIGSSQHAIIGSSRTGTIRGFFHSEADSGSWHL